MLRNMLGKTQFLGSMIVILSIALFAVACGGDEEPTPVPATSAPVATAAPTAAPTEAPAPVVEESTEVIAFHDAQWGSNWVHLAIARYILENGYGRETTQVQGSTGTMKLTLVEGDVHVNMETWRMNIPVWYDEHTASGALIDLAGTTDPLTALPAGSPGQTVAVAGQGFYIPAYMVNGDAERGIEATAPDLKSVQDLRKYKELFADPNDPTKGAVYNCILGWECQKVNRAKWFAYDMYTDFNVIEPGGSAALKAAVVAPYEAGEAFVSYYWQPTDVINLRDMILLEEPAWNQECQDATDLAVVEEPYESTIGCAFPISDTHTVVNAGFAERNPTVIQFLTNYFVESKLLAETEASKTADIEWVDVAIGFLRSNEDIWTAWITDDNSAEIIANVKEQLALEE
jgi:glycine betaine/proline transport system substrate-binding protein